MQPKFKVGDSVRSKSSGIHYKIVGVDSFACQSGEHTVSMYFSESELEVVEPKEEPKVEKKEWPCEHITKFGNTWAFKYKEYDQTVNGFELCPVCLAERPKEPERLEDVIRLATDKHHEMKNTATAIVFEYGIAKAVREHLKTKENKVLQIIKQICSEHECYDLDKVAKEILDEISR